MEDTTALEELLLGEGMPGNHICRSESPTVD